MHPIRVWAPHANAVDLVLPGEGRGEPMRREDGGWWTGPALRPGTDYAFSLDGGPPRPDPRSPWQPGGVHGPSRTFDPTDRPRTPGWRGRDARGAITYELHVGTFTPEGTLDSAVSRLDHLVDLGVEMVELLPLAEFPGDRGWGYDGVALYSVHRAYGGPAALARFVAAAHARGLGVCLDVVYNHLGPVGNYLAEFGPYFTDRYDTPWGAAVNLDGPGSSEVRRFVVEAALRWFRDFDVDALRLDAVHELHDSSERHILAELADATADLSGRLDRPLSLVAESELNDARMVEATARGGFGMTAQWADDYHHAVHALLTGERQGYYVDFGTLPVLERAAREAFRHRGTYSTYRTRTWGAPVPDEVPGHAFVVFAQNHDQVGNRGLGDRPSRVLTDGRLAVAAALILCSPFTPLIFMGEEWGARTPFCFFTDHSPELGESVRQGRAQEFARHGWAALYGTDVEPPDPQAPQTFEASRLDWSEPNRPRHRRILDFYRALIELRAAEPAISDDDRSRTRLTYDESGDWLVLHRGAVAVVVNLAAEERSVPLAGARGRRTLLSWDGAVVVDDGVRLPAHSVAILGPGGGAGPGAPG